MRRSRLLLAALCFLVALPLQIADFVTTGGLAPLWKVVNLALMGIGIVLFWRESKRAKRGSTPR